MEANHILRAEWNEEERPRLHYRIASKGAQLATKHGWAPLGHPITPDPLVERQAQDEANASSALPADFIEYVDRLNGAVDLSADRQSEIRHEIRDHLEDSATEQRRLGRNEAAATVAAIAGLGSPELLGQRITQAEVTRSRLLGGIRDAVVSALFGGTIGLAIAGIAVLATPLVGRQVAALLAGMGVHLYLPDTSGWLSEQVSLILVAATFTATRRGTPIAAVNTRRSLRAIKPIWGIGGAVLMAAIALFVPSEFDPLAAFTFGLLPVAWLLGTWRCQRHGDDLISRAGLAQTAIVFGVLMFVPGVRFWVFDPASPLPTSASAASSGVRVVVSADTGTITVKGDQSGWTDLNIEAWPAIRAGIQVAPDPAATTATYNINPSSAFLASSLPDSPHDWWLVLQGTATDGSRHTLNVFVLPGHEPLAPTNLFSLITGR